MAIKALNLAIEKSYVSDLDPAKGTPSEAKEATIWKIGALDSRTMAFLKDATTKFSVSPSSMSGDNPSVDTAVARAQQQFDTVAFGLRGWSNFKDAEGNDIKFETRKRMIGGSKEYRVVLDHLVSMIPEELISELAEQIASIQVVPALEKND